MPPRRAARPSTPDRPKQYKRLNPAHSMPDQSSPSSHKATIVGIGASAGGLAALRQFFTGIPANTGAAYVVVVHLSPDHQSHLAEVLQPHSQIPIIQVNETVAMEANHVYVIP